jgi:hypothetical protein
MAENSGGLDIWDTALATGASGAAGYAAGRYLKNRRLRGLKLQNKVVSIRPVRALLPSREGNGFGSRKIRYYVDKEGRRYEPAEYVPSVGSYQLSMRSRQYMMREDGVLFKLRKDGKYVMQVPQRPAGARMRRRRRK